MFGKGNTDDEALEVGVSDGARFNGRVEDAIEDDGWLSR